MVRSRIGSHVANEIATETDALPGVARRAPSLALLPWPETAAPARARSGVLERAKSSFSFIFEIVAPWIGKTARSVALGAMVALGGCEPGQRVEIDGVVRDGRTGEPIAGAQITTDDGRTLETDAEGRFSVSAFDGERLVASAIDRCDATARARLDRPLTLRLFDRLELDRERSAGFDAEVRIEVRARCDEEAPIEWRQIGGPVLGADRLRIEDRGRVLVVRTHSNADLVDTDREAGLAHGDYRLEAGVGGTRREVRVRRDSSREVRLLRPRDGRSAIAHERARGWLSTVHETSARRGQAGELGRFDAECWRCHAPALAPPADAGTHDAGDPWLAPCASCHDGPAHDSHAASEWSRSAMSQSPGEHASRSECARCHGGASFVARQERDEVSARIGSTSAIECATCHDPHEATSPRGLRVFDRADEVAGAPAEHLGSGAVCASCHGDGGVGPRDAAAHAPQASVLLGRGARGVPPMEDGAHRFVADTCVRCHMARPGESDVGGHTFSTRGVNGVARAACAPCHGSDVAPDAIGARDWDGDGRAGSVASEHERAIERASASLRAQIAALSVHDACGHVAADVAEREARLLLVDARGVTLGDCDEDGAIASSEASVTASALPARLADAAFDLSMLRRDGSAGAHNPQYAFRVIAAASQLAR